MVGKFVEFFGPGVAQLSIADRATIANMCPEYGATAAFFPVDHISVQYLEQTGRLALISDHLFKRMYFCVKFIQYMARSSVLDLTDVCG